ncbi:MAG: sulfite oxidase [Verrucomicrobiota bacterium]|nr:sulfite oxidase [Verrucomicrobiota bacterium]
MDSSFSKRADASGLIRRGEGPLNLEMPFSALDSFVTPNEQFYVRCHFPIPAIDPDSWRLTVEGAVANRLSLGLKELRALPDQTMMATMECAGNGRSFLEPKVKGVAWDLGAVGNASWTGVLLSDVLERAGVPAGATEVVLEGADKGEIKEAPRPPGEIHYARSLPIEKARNDVLLAFAMNGEPLSPSHGFPLRAVVPGWFGMAAVKWLTRIVVTERAFAGYYQTIDYTYWEENAGSPTLVPLQEMRVKAQIAQPVVGEVIARGTAYRVHGAAWAGEAGLEKIELSIDGGKKWQSPRLLGSAVRNAWRLWEFDWNVPALPDRCTLIARASDAEGRTQPAQRATGYGTYMVNQWLRVEVEIR